MRKTQVYKQFAQFKNGNMLLDDKPCSGCL